MRENRGETLTRAFLVLRVVGGGQWKRIGDVQDALSCSRRVAYRWIAAAEAAGFIEWRHERGVLGGGRFRLLAPGRREVA